MYSFQLKGAFSKFPDLKGKESFAKQERYRVADVNLVTPGLYIVENINNSFRFTIDNSEPHYEVYVPGGCYSHTSLVEALNDEIEKRVVTEHKQYPKFSYHLFSKKVSVVMQSGCAAIIYDSRTILFTLGFGRTKGIKLDSSTPAITANSQPHNLYITPTNTRLSRAQEIAFSRMELGSQRGDTIYVCLTGRTRCYKMGSKDPIANDSFISSAVASLSLGLPGFPARCLKSEYQRPPSTGTIELSLRNEAGEILEDVFKSPVVVLSTN